MAHDSKRSRSRHRSHHSIDFGASRERGTQPLLVTATDVCLGITFIGVTVCFGGRAAVGQLILVIGASLTACCWALHQLTSRDSQWAWTGSEWLWLAGIAIGVSQIIPLPRDWLLAISPQIGKILLPPGDDMGATVGADAWNQLSLAPWETTSGLAIFIAYFMLFFVIVQRVTTIREVEHKIYGVGILAVVMAVFAQLQCFMSNGKFFWFYAHPFMTTDQTPQGCFTNHNHLAQFLALGLGPLVWCVLQRKGVHKQPEESAPLPSHRDWVIPVVSSFGLVTVVLTALMTLSRGGLLATSIALVLSIGTQWRLGLVSAKHCLGLVVLTLVIGVICNLTGNEASLNARFEKTSGRMHVWRANIAVAHDFPILGTGVGTHADAHQLHLEQPLEGHEFTHAENSYLQVVSETGFVGLGLAALFIITGLWWCLGTLQNPDTRMSSIAAAVLGSLLANVTHAVVDFFWYTPACMLLLLVQLACVCRLYRMHRESSGRSVWAWRVSRLISLPTLGAVIVTAAWMIYVKLPAALAEPDQMRYVTLSLTGPEFYADDEERIAAQHEKRQAVLRASFLDPHNSRLLESAAKAYLEWFHLRQEKSENSIPLNHLRDAVRTADFESLEAMHEWLRRCAGKNLKLLSKATKTFQRALQQSPLRADSYVYLSDLAFMNREAIRLESAYLKQALTLRPYDPEIRFAGGRQAMENGELERAMESWRVAFEHSKRRREVIANLLAGAATPDFFFENLKPTGKSIAVLAQAFTTAGRTHEARQMWVRFVLEERQRLQGSLSEVEYESAVLGIHDADLALEEPEASVPLLSQALERLPYSFPIHQALGMTLSSLNEFSESAEHLQWCASRRPDDAALQRATAHAVKERLKTQPTIGTNPHRDIAQ